jgi:hypothetical protein
MENEEFTDITGLPAKLMNMSLKDLVEKYGNISRVEKYAKTLHLLSCAQLKEIEIKIKRLELSKLER